MSDATSAGDGPPDFQVSAQVVAHNVRIELNGIAIADSDRAVLYKESRLAPVYYFPREDVRMDLM